MAVRSSMNICGVALCALGLSMACGTEAPATPMALPPAPAQAATAGQPPIAVTPMAGSPAPVVRMPQGGSAAAPTASGTPAGMNPSSTTPPGMNPSTNPSGMNPSGMNPSGMNPEMNPPTGAPADPGAMQPGIAELPECDTSAAPDEFEPNPSVGGGGSQFTDSPHFRIYGASGSDADAAIDQLEAAYSCFVETLCWRSSGLSINSDSDSGPYYKMNIYGVGSLGSAAGQMFSDAGAGLSYLRVVNSYLAQPNVTVHEYGHALTYHEEGWVEQTRTGAWWETVANFVADTHMTSPLCEAARARFGVAEGKTIIELDKVIGDSHQVIVDGSSGSGNYYQAWPFLTYLTNNPDNYAGLGATALRDMFRGHEGNNETPLHVLERVAAPVKVQTIVGRYWARMAYVDIGHEQAQEAFMSARSRLNFANLDAMGAESYRVKSGRQPRYFGSNIIPLSGTGALTVKVTSSASFTATLAIRASSGVVRYVDLAGGAGQASVEAGEEASLVVVNTPDMLYQYDPFSIGGDVARGLDYSVELTGATPAN